MTFHSTPRSANGTIPTHDAEQPETCESAAERRSYVRNWIANARKRAAAGSVLAGSVLMLPLLAQAQDAGEFVSLADLEGVSDFALQPDGSLQVTLQNGRQVILGAQEFAAAGNGQFLVSAAAAETIAEVAALGALGGVPAGALAGGAAGAGGLAAAFAGGDGDDGGGGDGGNAVAPAVLNRADFLVANTVSSEEINLPPLPEDVDEVTVTFEGEDGGEKAFVVEPDEEGNWTLVVEPEDLEGMPQGPVAVKITREGEDGEPVEIASGQVIVDTIAPTIAIDEPVAGDGVLNGQEEDEGPLTISGTTEGAEAGQTVTVTVGGQEYTTTVGEDGTWAVEVPAADLPGLGDGATVNVTADVDDAAGNPAEQDTATFDTDFTATIAIDPISEGDLTTIDQFFDLEITGTTEGVEAGRMVTVGFAGTDYMGEVQGDGTWSVNVPQADLDALGEDVTEVEVSAGVTDEAGNAANATQTVETDFTAPPFGITEPEDGAALNADTVGNDLDVSGVSVPGSDITVTLNGVEKMATAGEDGSWSVTYASDELPEDGVYQIEAGGTLNENPVGVTNAQLTIDTVAPEIAITTPISGDDVLNATEQGEPLTIGGTTDGVEEGQTVKVMVGESEYTAPVVIDDGGTFTVEVPAEDLAGLGDGTTVNVTADVQDAAGNPAPQAMESFDTDFSAAIGIDPISGGDLSTVDTFFDLEIAGTTTGVEPGQQVNVVFAGRPYQGEVQADNTWAVTVPSADLQALEEDVTEVGTSAEVMDQAGNTATANQTVPSDFTAPPFDIAAPEDGAALNATTVGETLEVRGGSLPDSEVTVTLNGVEKMATAGEDGTWSVTFAPDELPEDGTYPIEAAATLNGNPVGAANVDLLIDTMPPEVTIDTPISGDGVLNAMEQGEALTISGTATGVEEGATVVVPFNPEQEDVGLVDENGNWSVTIDPEDLAGLGDGETVDVTADIFDGAGNRGQATASFETDFTPPQIMANDLEGVADGGTLTAAEVYEATSPTTVAQLDSLTLSGTSDAPDDSDVRIVVGAETFTGKVQGGEWSVELDTDTLSNVFEGQESATLTATVSDAAGNEASDDFTVNLDVVVPEIDVTDPADGAVLGLDEYEGGVTVSGVTQDVPAGQEVRVTLGLGDIPAPDVPIASGPVQEDGTWSVNFPENAISRLPDQTQLSVTASVSDGIYPGRVIDSDTTVDTDFEPQIELGDITDFDDGTLVLANTPEDPAVSGSTRGVETGQEVTVTIDGPDGELFTGTGQVNNGQWQVPIPAETVNAIEAGASYTVTANVSNAAGRSAPEASAMVYPYEAALNYLAAGAENTGLPIGVFFDPRNDFPDDRGVGLGEDVSFNEDVVTYDEGAGVVVADGIVSLPDAGLTEPGKLKVAGLGFLGDDVDPTFDPLAEFHVNVQDPAEIIRFDVESAAGGQYRAVIGTDGDDELTPNSGPTNSVDTVLQGRGGNDQIDASAPGVNTVLFEATPDTAADNGNDTVVGFTLGGDNSALPDRIGFAVSGGVSASELRGDGTDFQSTAGGDVGADVGFLVFTTALQDTLGQTRANVIFNELEGVAPGDQFFMLAGDGEDAVLGFVELETETFVTIDDLATFEDIGDLSGFTEDNVLGFEPSTNVV